MLSILQKLMTKSSKLSTIKGYRGYFDKRKCFSKQFPAVLAIPAEEKFIILKIYHLFKLAENR